MGLWVVWNVDRSLVSIAPLRLKMWLLHRRFLSAKRKPRPPCRGFLPLRVPPPSSRESHCSGKWLTGATKWRSSLNQLKRGDVGKSPWGTCEGRARSALYAELDAKRKAKKRKKRNKKNLSLGISLAMSAECR